MKLIQLYMGFTGDGRSAMFGLTDCGKVFEYDCISTPSKSYWVQIDVPFLNKDGVELTNESTA